MPVEPDVDCNNLTFSQVVAPSPGNGQSLGTTYDSSFLRPRRQRAHLFGMGAHGHGNTRLEQIMVPALIAVAVFLLVYVTQQIIALSQSGKTKAGVKAGAIPNPLGKVHAYLRFAIWHTLCHPLLLHCLTRK